MQYGLINQIINSQYHDTTSSKLSEVFYYSYWWDLQLFNPLSAVIVLIFPTVMVFLPDFKLSSFIFPTVMFFLLEFKLSSFIFPTVMVFRPISDSRRTFLNLYTI